MNAEVAYHVNLKVFFENDWIAFRILLCYLLMSNSTVDSVRRIPEGLQ